MCRKEELGFQWGVQTVRPTRLTTALDGHLLRSQAAGLTCLVKLYDADVSVRKN